MSGPKLTPVSWTEVSHSRRAVPGPGTPGGHLPRDPGRAGRTQRIAERAGTGKSAIYRRWATKTDLVAETLAHAFPPPGPAESTGDLRTDLLLFHRRMAEALGGTLGAALRANVGQHREHPELAAALRDQVLAPRHRLLGQLLAAGIRRGEVRPGALTPECIEAGPALLRQHFIESGQQPSEDAICRIADNVLIPMLRANPAQPAIGP